MPDAQVLANLDFGSVELHANIDQKPTSPAPPKKKVIDSPLPPKKKAKDAPKPAKKKAKDAPTTPTKKKVKSDSA
ncbi:MAG: hypothetical protein Q4D23_12065, partial [Bacteroidales bacterium]|nr:hypothetical protein [Bacteroidales bacterium]